MSEINEICKTCPHFEKETNIEGSKGVCGEALSLAHWQDAKNWVRDGDTKCEWKDMTHKECMDSYWGRGSAR